MEVIIILAKQRKLLLFKYVDYLIIIHILCFESLPVLDLFALILPSDNKGEVPPKFSNNCLESSNILYEVKYINGSES